MWDLLLEASECKKIISNRNNEKIFASDSYVTTVSNQHSRVSYAHLNGYLTVRKTNGTDTIDYFSEKRLPLH